MPSQMYGKPGITTFVDRSSGINTTSFSDQGLESRQNKELKPDVNENKIKQSSQRRGDDGIRIEMNEVDHHQRNPPFTDFQGKLKLVNKSLCLHVTFLTATCTFSKEGTCV